MLGTRVWLVYPTCADPTLACFGGISSLSDEVWIYFPIVRPPDPCGIHLVSCNPAPAVQLIQAGQAGISAKASHSLPLFTINALSWAHTLAGQGWWEQTRGSC